MRTLLLGLAILCSAQIARAQVSIMELRAVQVKYFGGITGFDKAGFRTLKSAIAGLVADGTIAHFKTTEVGMEGGGAFCLQLNDDPQEKITTVTDMLDTIKPSAITIYSQDLLKACE